MEGNGKDQRPAIRFINYMSGREECEAVHIVGPYGSAEARNRDLQRLECLPLGASEYHGGVELFAATMAEAVGELGWSLYVAEPAKVAGSTTIRGFFANFSGYPEEDDDDTVDTEDDIHPDQIALLPATGNWR